MELDGDWMNDVVGFAIDSYVHVPDSPEQSDFCNENSDKELRKWIYDCGGKIVLRKLTDKEKAKIQRYKMEQQGNPEDRSLIRNSNSLNSFCSVK